MSVRFGVFAPQGWRMDLTEIADPIEQYEAMTAVAKADLSPKRRNNVPLPTPAAAATWSMETASAPCSANSRAAAFSTAVRLRAASARSLGGGVRRSSSGVAEPDRGPLLSPAIGGL